MMLQPKLHRLCHYSLLGSVGFGVMFRGGTQTLELIGYANIA